MINLADLVAVNLLRVYADPVTGGVFTMLEFTILEIALWGAGIVLLAGVALYAAQMRQKEQNIFEKRRLDAIGKTKSKDAQFFEEPKNKELKQQIEEIKLRLNDK